MRVAYTRSDTWPTGEERERLLRREADRFPDLAKHARNTECEIPVIVFTRLGDT